MSVPASFDGLVQILQAVEKVDLTRTYKPTPVCCPGCVEPAEWIVANENGAKIISVAETSSLLARCLALPFHTFRADISANDGTKVATFDRPGMNALCACLPILFFTAPGPCVACCPLIPMCQDAGHVYTGIAGGEPGYAQGTEMVTITQGDCAETICVPTYHVMENGAEVAVVRGSPFCSAGIFGSKRFEYTSPDGQAIAAYTWAPSSAAGTTSSIQYTQGITPQQKATVMSSSLLLNQLFMAYDYGGFHCTGTTSCRIACCSLNFFGQVGTPAYVYNCCPCCVPEQKV